MFSFSPCLMFNESLGPYITFHGELNVGEFFMFRMC